MVTLSTVSPLDYVTTGAGTVEERIITMFTVFAVESPFTKAMAVIRIYG